jgi:hypothetical protein
MTKVFHTYFIVKRVNYDEVRWAEFDSLKVAELELDDGQFYVKKNFCNSEFTPGCLVIDLEIAQKGYQILSYTCLNDYDYSCYVYNTLYGDIVKKYQYAE